MQDTTLAKRLAEINRMLVLLVALLAAIGVLMMVSAGSGDWSEFAYSHLTKALMGLVLMLAVALMPIGWLYRYAYVIYGVLLALLIVVDVSGHIGMGAQRWIRLGGVYVQPSEFMKVCVILALARYFYSLHTEDVKRIQYLVVPLLLIAAPALLILRQPNLGTAVITIGVGVCILFMAGMRVRYFLYTFAAALITMPIIWQFLHDYQKRRIYTFLDPTQDPLGAGYNILQSMIAIGSGGFWGKGFMHGSQGQLNFLPEKHTDFIFTMFAEEWGFVGSMILLGLFALLLLIGTIIAASSRSVFGCLIATGVTAMLFIHMFINMAMVMGMIPVVGVPLPFLSYGGSMMLSVMLAVGLLLNAYIHRDRPLLLAGRMG